MHIVDDKARMAAVAHHHTAQLLIAVCKIEAALRIVIVKARNRELVSARFLPIKQT